MKTKKSVLENLIGMRCIHICVDSSKMHKEAPFPEVIIFNEHYINEITEENPARPSDYGMGLNIEEHNDHIIVSSTDGDSEPVNNIFLFSKLNELSGI